MMLTDLRYTLGQLCFRISAALQQTGERLIGSPDRQVDPTLKIPRSRVVSATFNFELPRPATHDEIEEWVEFNIGGSSTMSGDNSLIDEELEAVSDVTLRDTGKFMHTSLYRYQGRTHIVRTMEDAPYVGPSTREYIHCPDHPDAINGPPPWMVVETDKAN